MEEDKYSHTHTFQILKMAAALTHIKYEQVKKFLVFFVAISLLKKIKINF
jgi:hypothetical protein